MRNRHHAMLIDAGWEVQFGPDGRELLQKGTVQIPLNLACSDRELNKHGLLPHETLDGRVRVRLQQFLENLREGSEFEYLCEANGVWREACVRCTMVRCQLGC